MNIESKRFGSIEVSDDRIITFKDGLLGFPEKKQFILVDDPNDGSLPFKWLISVESPDMAFLVTDPGIFFKDYVFDLNEDDRAKIGANSEDDVSVISLLTVPADPKKITANLRGPLVINWRSLVGRQVVLKDSAYTTKHFIFIQESPVTKEESGKDEASKVSAVVAANANAQAESKSLVS